MDALSNQELRKFITTHFNDSELKKFCFDYFPEVLNDFGDGMRKSDKVMDLVIYCRNRQLMTNLSTNLRLERQTTYQQVFSPQESLFAPPAKAKPRDPNQIFISYSTKDATPLAIRLAKDLRGSGHPVWIATESIMPGEKWGEAIERGLQESGIFILLLTPKAVDSYWVKKEMHAAMSLESEHQMRILTLDVKTCALPLFWKGYQHFSFRDGYKKGRAQLWGALAGQPVKPPPAKPQLSATSKAIENLSSQLQELPDWMKWGGIVVALLLVFSIGYAIFGDGNGDGDEPMVTIAVVEPTEGVAIAVVETPTNTRTAVTQPASTIAPSPTLLPTHTVAPKPTNTPAPILAIGSTETRAKDGAVMMYVPAGEFEMGSDDGGSDEQPIHTVYVDAFWIDQTEVTNEQYEHCVADRQCEESSYADNDDFNGAQQPVVVVSWNDADAYCGWVNGRLPTEAEWEYAARGPVSNTYPWGDESPNADLLNYNHKVGKTTIVSNYSPDGDNWVGASDMVGNVWEWTSSLYQSYPYDDNDGRENESSTDVWVLRGGSWSSSDNLVRAANRFYFVPAGRFYFFIGFRCAQE